MSIIASASEGAGFLCSKGGTTILYYYHATVTRVIDGDTAEVVLDLGCHVFHSIRLRFSNIDAPETRTRNDLEKQAGLLVADYVRDLIEGKGVYVSSHKPNEKSFDRYVGMIYLAENEKDSLNEHLLYQGFVIPHPDGEWTEKLWQEVIDTLS